MWPNIVKDQALASCRRCCCICHKFCGTNMELHHIRAEADEGASTLENCIPLCFDCHAEVGHYNVRHPKGTKYRANELRMHRDEWFRSMSEAKLLTHIQHNQFPSLPDEVYEGQRMQFKGYLSLQTFTGAPNYEDFRSDELESCCLLTLPEPFRFSYEALEAISSETTVVPMVQVLHLVLNKDLATMCKEKINSVVYVTGRVFPSINGHHRGDALIEVDRFE